MKKIHKRNFKRNDKKYLLLFGYNQHYEESGKELKITEDSRTTYAMESIKK